MADVYGPVMTALNEHINQTQYNCDLADLLSVRVGGPATVSGTKHGDYMPSNRVGGELNISKTFTLPPDLVERFAKMKTYCIMGLFNDMNRVWLTIDNVIYIWNYENGSDLAYYDGIEQVITCLGFVKPAPNVLPAEIAYLLCVVTPSEVIILGIKVQDNNLNFLPTPVARMNDRNHTVTVIQATKDGRIFMGTADNSVLEVSYMPYVPWSVVNYIAAPRSHLISWKMLNHTASMLGSFVPSLFKFSEAEAVAQMTVDEHRGKCYTLTDMGTLTMFEFGGASREEHKFHRQDTLTVQQLSQAASNVARGSVERVNIKSIVHVSPLYPGPGPLHLLLVDNTGARFYLSTAEARLRLLHVRLPPPHEPQRGSAVPLDVKLCAVSRGTVLLLTRRGEENDMLITVSPDPFPGAGSFTEAVSSSWPPGRAWSLLPIGQGHVYSPQYYKDSVGPVPRKPLTAYQTQHVDPVRRFLLVSAQGLVHLELPSPIQRLKELFYHSHNAENEAVRAWYSHMGPEEGAFASLLISSEDGLTPHLVENALQALYLYCCPMPMRGIATASTNREKFLTSPRPISRPPPGQWLSSMPPVIHGIFLYLGRVILPLWNNPMVEERTLEKDNIVERHLRFDADELQWFLHHVRHLHQLLLSQRAQLDQVIHAWTQATAPSNPVNRTPSNLRPSLFTSSTPPRFTVPSPPRYNSTPVAPKLLTSTASPVLATTSSTFSPVEELLMCLPTFLSSLDEMLCFWKLLACHNFPRLCRGLSANHVGQLRQTSIMHLLQFQVDTRSLINGLITALLNSFLSDEASIEIISARLLKECPSLFAKEDAACAKANELVVKASSFPLPREYALLSTSYDDQEDLQTQGDVTGMLRKRQALLHEAVDLYCEAGGNVDVGELVAHLQKVGFYAGIVRLCMQVAQLRDPEGLARQLYLQESGPLPLDALAEDPRVGGRRDAYQHMVKAIDRLYAIAFSESFAVALLSASAADHSSVAGSSEVAMPKSASEAAAVKRLMRMAQRELFTILARVFQYCRELMVHYEMLLWMLNKDGMMKDAMLHGFTLDGRLSNSSSNISSPGQHGLPHTPGCSPHLETFLRLRLRQCEENVTVRDLLWRLYELQGKRVEAARILDELAVMSNGELNLTRREECLNRAVLMLRVYGHEEGGAATEFLHELEDKLEMCKIQMAMLQELQELYGTEMHTELSTVASQLNTALYPASSLYDVACEYDLILSQLLLLKAYGASGGDDAMTGFVGAPELDDDMVADCWRRLLTRVLTKGGGDAAGEEVATKERVAQVLTMFRNVPHLFLLKPITSVLENHANDRGFNFMWVTECLQKVGVPLAYIVNAYDSLLPSKSNYLHGSSRERVYFILLKVIELALNEADKQPEFRRKAVYNQYEDQVNTYCIEVATKQDSLAMKENELRSQYKRLLNRIERVM